MLVVLFYDIFAFYSLCIFCLVYFLYSQFRVIVLRLKGFNVCLSSLDKGLMLRQKHNVLIVFVNIIHVLCFSVCYFVVINFVFFLYYQLNSLMNRKIICRIKVNILRHNRSHTNKCPPKIKKIVCFRPEIYCLNSQTKCSRRYCNLLTFDQNI